jgi:hypothetical protein
MRFDDVQITSGFGILYLDGFTSDLSEHTACGASIGEYPDHLFQVNETIEFKLVLQTSFDLVIAIENEDGEMICGETTSAVNENITVTHTFEPGQYRLFVGRRDQSDSYLYRLILSE